MICPAVFPVTNGIIRNVSNCAASKTKLSVYIGVVFEEFFDYLQWIACCLGGCFMGFVVDYFGFSCGYSDSCFWVETDEGVLYKFFWSLYGL